MVNEGQRNCNRLQTAGSAIAWLGSHPEARQPFLYMCAKGHVTTPHPDDVRINGNVFSAPASRLRPLATEERPSDMRMRASVEEQNPRSYDQE
jgi:hypothetical protein